MVVWGGNTGGASNSGGRYHPATDTWLPMDASNAPLERFAQSVVWTGAGMGTILANTQVFYVAAVGILFMGEKPTARFLVAGDDEPCCYVF